MRDAAKSMVRQVETQTSEDMAKKFVRGSSARPPPHMQAWKVGTTKTTTQTTITQNEVTTVKKSLRDSRVDFQATAKVQKVQMTPLSRRPQEPSDFLILYHSLSRDSVLPQVFEEAFSGVFAHVVETSDRCSCRNFGAGTITLVLPQECQACFFGCGIELTMCQ